LESSAGYPRGTRRPDLRHEIIKPDFEDSKSGQRKAGEKDSGDKDLGCTREFNNRAKVSLLCEARQGSEPWKVVRLDDISQTGFRIAMLPDCKPATPLRIRIPGLQMLTAHVRWQRGKAVGCEFAEPLHVAVFEHIVKQAG
jgi:hypothetical protein